MSFTESQSGLPNTSLMNALSQGPSMNVNNNIISGPNPMEYWNHSPGVTKPLVREEQPLMIQGNVGFLLKQEADDQYKSCGFTGNQQLPKISGSPNCTAVFTPDMYTLRNTCQDNCAVTYPESYGGKDFGYPEGMPKISNSHQIHAYQNTRASMSGQGPSNDLGCYEFIPRISSSSQHNTCALNQQQVYSQVGSWNHLPQYNQIQFANYGMDMGMGQSTQAPTQPAQPGTLGPN